MDRSMSVSSETGKYNGQGTFTWPDGQKYVVGYRDDEATSSQDSVWIN